MPFSSLKVGAGGLITGIDIHSDSTLVCRTDVFGGYYYDRTAPNPGNAGGIGAWRQLITTDSMAGYSVVDDYLMGAAGINEVRVAPTNSNIFYMVYRGWIWVSSNRGATWTRTNFTQDTAITANSGQQRAYRYKMAVDTNTSNAVHFVKPNGNVFYTLNGGTNWTQATGTATND